MKKRFQSCIEEMGIWIRRVRGIGEVNPLPIGKLSTWRYLGNILWLSLTMPYGKSFGIPPAGYMITPKGKLVPLRLFK